MAAPDRRSRPDPGRRTELLWWFLLAGYVIIYLLYWPLCPGIHDETGFINQALLWSRPGQAGPRVEATPVDDLLQTNGRFVGWRNPGRSLLLLPLIPFGGTRGLYVSSLLLHLASALVAAEFFRRHAKSPLWAALLLFHPTLLLYSRTIMADGPAGLALLLALFALTNRRAPGLWAGLAVGAAAVLRYQVGPLLLFFAAGILTLTGRNDRWKQAALCLAGGATVGLGLFAYNHATYGNVIGYTGQGRFDVAYLGWNAGTYAIALMTLWPLLPLALCLDRSEWRWIVRLLVLPFLAVMLLYSWHDVGSGAKDTAVLSLRLLQPILPIWIVSYVFMLDDGAGAFIRSRWPALVRWPVLLAFCLGLLAAQAVLFHHHQQHLRSLQDARRAVLATIPPGSIVIANGAVRKLFALLDEEPPAYRWMPYERDNQVLNPSIRPDEDAAVYFALLPKRPGYEFPDELARLVRRYRLHRIPTDAPRLMVFRAEPSAGGPPMEETR